MIYYQEITFFVQMATWFFRFLKAGFIILALLAVGVTMLVRWTTPDPKDIALIPMSVDTGSMQGAGFIANSTRAAWTAYIASTNTATSEVKISRVWVTTEPLQAVSYSTPPMSEKDEAQFRIIYAKKLEVPTIPMDTLLSLPLPSSPPSPVQLPPSQADRVPKAPAATIGVP